MASVVMGMSVGSLLLVIVFIILLTYCVVGVLFNKAVIGGCGLELIPNSMFWMSLPGHIKDGVLFFAGLFCRSRAETTIYRQL
ncbi:hypothetical protein ACJMK2_039818 [Sinanodonta woodiana]|uniref:NADH dehydrogenase subunit 4L n=1 Tax=Sinanodonta woodiana TaxID=1069815 RepID=A0ABD3WE37_SINWO